MSSKLSLDALRKRAIQFVKLFESVEYESGYDQNFSRAWCELFGISPQRLEFQFRVKKKKGGTRRIDALLPGMLLIEMKSKGEDLEKAYDQAASYLPLMQDKDLPQFILVSDFAHLHFYERLTGQKIEICLEELPQKIEAFLPLAGYEAKVLIQQEKIQRDAAEKMAALHDLMRENGYHGEDLENYLVRLLFCLFADDTGLFPQDSFLDLIENTKEDGTDLHGELASLFTVLNTPIDKRPRNLPERFMMFPYVNGRLFDGLVAPYFFDEASRKHLITLSILDWNDIDPSIFGSLFQAVMHHEGETKQTKTHKRRELGAHYTSEENILKVIQPLFLEGLRSEFSKIRVAKQLQAFHEKLAQLQIFDPACGCGNFLIVAYRELRLLELEVIERLIKRDKNQSDVALLVRLDVDQFHGIEIDPTAAKIATVAMWLTDHQMNLKAARLGAYLNRLPLTKRPNIVCGNALALNWADILPPENCNFIIGNPPFIGYSYQSQAQKKDMMRVTFGMNGAGVLDYVAGWYILASQYLKKAKKETAVAFVSTNSITQGEQVAILWQPLIKQGIHFHFAHRTFKWSNEGRGVAAVHCVIIGFGLTERAEKTIYDYEDIAGEPTAYRVQRINPYLVNAPTVFIEKRRKPLCNEPEMIKGSAPTDGGHLLLSPEEAKVLTENDKIAAKYLRPFLGAEEFINKIERYCLWLKESTAQDRLSSPEIQRRMEKVAAMRSASPKLPTQKLAELPYLFGEIRQKKASYLLIPRVSSETRKYVPIGYLDQSVIASDASFILPNASFYHFGMLCSTFHNAWLRAVGGRLESRYRYSNTIVYNNFPFPQEMTAKQKQAIEKAAEAILDARTLEEERAAAQGQKTSLAQMYAQNNMPVELVKAHAALDKAVDAAYQYQGAKDDASRVAFLFEEYQKRVAPMLETETPMVKKAKPKK